MRQLITIQIELRGPTAKCPPEARAEAIMSAVPGIAELEKIVDASLHAVKPVTFHTGPIGNPTKIQFSELP